MRMVLYTIQEIVKKNHISKLYKTMTHQLNEPIQYTRLIRVPVLPRGRARTLREMLPKLRVEHGGDLRTTKLQIRWEWNHPSIAGEQLASYGAVISVTSYRKKTTERAAEALPLAIEQVRMLGPVVDEAPASQQTMI